MDGNLKNAFVDFVLDFIFILFAYCKIAFKGDLLTFYSCNNYYVNLFICLSGV